jgi:hypothetical protein
MNDSVLVLRTTADVDAMFQDIDGLMDMAKKFMKSDMGKSVLSKGQDYGKAAVEKATVMAKIGGALFLLAQRIVLFNDWLVDNKITDEALTGADSIAAKFWAKFSDAPDKVKSAVKEWCKRLVQAMESTSKPDSGEESKAKALMALAGSKSLSALSAENDEHSDLYSALYSVASNEEISNVSNWGKVVELVVEQVKGKNALDKPKLKLFFQAGLVTPSVNGDVLGAYILHACNASIDASFHHNAARLKRLFAGHHAALVQSQYASHEDWPTAFKELPNIHGNPTSSALKAEISHPIAVAPLLSASCSEQVRTTSAQIYNTLAENIDANLGAMETAVVQQALKDIGGEEERLMAGLQQRQFTLSTHMLNRSAIGTPSGIGIFIKE